LALAGQQSVAQSTEDRSTRLEAPTAATGQGSEAQVLVHRPIGALRGSPTGRVRENTGADCRHREGNSLALDI